MQDWSKEWRWIVQLGRNQATYKVALAEQLLRFAEKGEDKIPLDELANAFKESYRQRVKLGRPQQPIPGRWTAVERALLQHEDKDQRLELIRETALRNMVLQKFHNLEGGIEAPRFYEPVGKTDDHVMLTSRALSLVDNNWQSLLGEARSRWDLLEHGFTSSNPEAIKANEFLAQVQTRHTRRNLTHLISTLSGYQNGNCMYCDLPLENIHVDHVIPFSKIGHNQVWNLVLSDDICNENKSDQMPPKWAIHRLIERNEALIRSEKPIKQTILRDLGLDKESREAKTWSEYHIVKEINPRNWIPEGSAGKTMLEEYVHYVHTKR